MSKYKEITHQVIVGTQVYNIKVDATEFDGKTQIKTDSLITAQRKLAESLLEKTESFDIDIFNYTLDTSGKRAKDIAALLETSPAHISQVRRGKTEVSKQFWKLFRVVMLTLLSGDERRTTDRILLGA